MKPKYGALRIIATIYRIIAILIGIGSLVLAVLSIVNGLSARGNININGQVFSSPGASTFIVSGLAILLSGLLTAVALYAFAQLIMLLIDMEENTRRSAALLERLYRQRSTLDENS